MLGRLLLRVLITGAMLLLMVRVLPGFSVDYAREPEVIGIAALLLALINATIGPILMVLTLPLRVLTLGLFTIVVNAGLLMLVDHWVDGLTIDGFGWALVGAVVFGLGSAILSALVSAGRRRRW